MSAYRVHISKDNLMFAAGHFVSYDADQVEPLHGHNYSMSVTIEGQPRKTPMCSISSRSSGS